MNVGKLYQVKKYFWFLYPSKEIAALALDDTFLATACAPNRTAAYAAAYSKNLKCNVSYIAPNSIFCLLEQDGKYCKILTTNGELGWIYITVWSKDDIEEVNQ